MSDKNEQEPREAAAASAEKRPAPAEFEDGKPPKKPRTPEKTDAEKKKKEEEEAEDDEEKAEDDAHRAAVRKRFEDEGAAGPRWAEAWSVRAWRLCPPRWCVRCEARCDGAPLTVTREEPTRLVFADDHRAVPALAGVCEACAAWSGVLDDEAAERRVASLREAAATRWSLFETATEASGLQFCPDEVHARLVDATGVPADEEASVFLAATLEYLAAEVLELSGNAARDSRAGRVLPGSMARAIGGDDELVGVLEKLASAPDDEDDDENGAAAPTPPPPTLLAAARRGDAGAVREWLRVMAERRGEFAAGAESYTRLRPEELDGLARKLGDDTDEKDDDDPADFPANVSPLDAALAGGHAEVAGLLLAAGATAPAVALEALPAGPAVSHALERQLPDVLRGAVAAYAGDGTGGPARLVALAAAKLDTYQVPEAAAAAYSRHYCELPEGCMIDTALLLDGDDGVTNPDSEEGAESRRLLLCVWGDPAYDDHCSKVIMEAFPPCDLVAKVSDEGNHCTFYGDAAKLSEAEQEAMEARFHGNPFTSWHSQHESSWRSPAICVREWRGLQRDGAAASSHDHGVDWSTGAIHVRVKGGRRVRVKGVFDLEVEEEAVKSE